MKFLFCFVFSNWWIGTAELLAMPAYSPDLTYFHVFFCIIDKEKEHQESKTYRKIMVIRWTSWLRQCPRASCLLAFVIKISRRTKMKQFKRVGEKKSIKVFFMFNKAYFNNNVSKYIFLYKYRHFLNNNICFSVPWVKKVVFCNVLSLFLCSVFYSPNAWAYFNPI